MGLLNAFLLLLNRHLEWVIVVGMLGFGWIQVQRRRGKQTRAEKAWQKAVASNLNEPASLHPEIDSSKCTGCASCTTVCPEGDILQLVDHRAVLVGPTKCVGHGECERACPMGAIQLVFGTKTRGLDIPRLTTHYETNVPGLYIAGELGGMGLIRNAVKQGRLAATHALSHLENSIHSDYDLIIVGAGPAGISAGLTAIEQNRRYIIVEQNSFGGTVSNFPRQKIVMSHPAELPIVGTMKFNRNQIKKEELLSYWEEIRERVHLDVKEHVRFESLEQKSGIFHVKTSEGTFTTSKVLLAMGVRGTPRKLGLPNEDLPKVTYNLLEPEQYRNNDCVVVGGGNAGVEAAIMLANPKYGNRVKILIRGDKFDRCNEENQKRILQLEKNNLIEICFKSSVKEISRTQLKVDFAGVLKTVPNDFLFIFAGAELPFKFLMDLGVKIDKKFGEALRKTS